LKRSLLNFKSTLALAQAGGIVAKKKFNVVKHIKAKARSVLGLRPGRIIPDKRRKLLDKQRSVKSMLSIYLGTVVVALLIGFLVGSTVGEAAGYRTGRKDGVNAGYISALNERKGRGRKLVSDNVWRPKAYPSKKGGKR
jgi:hypothetical protein